MDRWKSLCKLTWSGLFLNHSAPIRLIALQYAIHSIATMFIVLTFNTFTVQCAYKSFHDTVNKKNHQLALIDIHLEQVCINQTIYSVTSKSMKRILFTQEIMVNILLVCLLFNGRRSEKVLWTSGLVFLLWLKVSSSFILPIKLYFESLLAYGSNGLLNSLLYPFQMFIFLCFNVLSLPFTRIFLRGILLENVFFMSDVFKTELNVGWKEDKDASSTWYYNFLPWQDFTGVSNKQIDCIDYCQIHLEWSSILAAMVLTIHFLFVVLALFPNVLLSNDKQSSPIKFGGLTTDLRNSLPRKRYHRSGIVRFSFDETRHRQSYADEGFADSPSMETVAFDSLQKRNSSVDIESSLDIINARHVYHVGNNGHIGSVCFDSDLNSVKIHRGDSEETLKYVERKEDIVQMDQADIGKILFEVNINSQAYICLRADVMKVVCDKLFTTKITYFGTNTNDELLKTNKDDQLAMVTENRELPCNSSNDLDKVLEWYKGTEVSDDVSQTKDMDGYSDDESFINGFRL